MTQANRNQPFRVEIDHDGVDTESYTLIRDGVEVETKPRTPATPVVFPFLDGLPAGSYEFAARANGPGGQTVFSETVKLVVVPGAPAQGRIVIAVG